MYHIHIGKEHVSSVRNDNEDHPHDYFDMGYTGENIRYGIKYKPIDEDSEGLQKLLIDCNGDFVFKTLPLLIDGEVKMTIYCRKSKAFLHIELDQDDTEWLQINAYNGFVVKLAYNIVSYKKE